MNTIEILISGISLLATIGIFSALYKIGKKFGIFEESIRHINQSLVQIQDCINKLEERINKIEERIDKLEERIDKLEERMDKLEELYASMHADILAIKTFLITKYKNAEAIWGIKNSPTKLNDNGKMLFNAINGEQFLIENKNILLQLLTQKAPKTPLDVENDSNEILLRQTENDIFNDLKNWVYESPALMVNDEDGQKPYIITLNDICFVLSIPLRDMYIEQHPELFKCATEN